MPVPEWRSTDYYLVGSYRVLAVDAATQDGRLACQQSEQHDGTYHLTIGDLSQLNQSNRVVVHKQERSGSSYVMVDPWSAHTPISLDLMPFLPHFLARSAPEDGRK